MRNMNILYIIVGPLTRRDDAFRVGQDPALGHSILDGTSQKRSERIRLPLAVELVRHRPELAEHRFRHRQGYRTLARKDEVGPCLTQFRGFPEVG